MTTLSLNSVNKKLVKYLLFISLIIISSTASFSEVHISKIKNEVHVLNLHGKRLLINENTNIKNGDYLSTREKPATIIFKDNLKICFSSNSSIKVSKNKNQISFELKRGSILFSTTKKSQDNYNLDFFSYNLDNFKDVVIISITRSLEIVNFEKNQDVFYKDDVNKINLPQYTILELSKNGKVSRETKLLEDNKFSKKFLKICAIKLPEINNSNNNIKLQSGCISQNGKLVCGNKYK